MMLKRSLRVTRAYEGRDPMASGCTVPGAMWIGYDLPPWPVAAPYAAEPVFVQLDEYPQQHNQHVMDYWTARLNRLAMRTIGRK